jgi:2,3,4,5-tetrahydropyridine-2,6-dicarboxylate N-succinyltransferase
MPINHLILTKTMRKPKIYIQQDLNLMEEYIKIVEDLWENKAGISQNKQRLQGPIKSLLEIIEKLDQGIFRVCEKKDGKWHVNVWLKQAILLYFQVTDSMVYESGYTKWYDKVPSKFADTSLPGFQNAHSRIVPGAFIRKGSYIGKNAIIMPSFVNMGAYIDDKTMIDTWATIGSCAQIGKNCHISGGAGIGGVLEPLQNNPVIIEDGCFIGARSEIVEGVIVEEGAVLGMGTFIGASTKIVDRYTGSITYGRVPAYSVVVPGSMPSDDPNLPSIYCVVIIKTVDASTRSKTAINELLRG